MTAPLPAGYVAGQLVDEWAAERLTVPTPAERDLARWIVDKSRDQADDVDPTLIGPKAAFESWVGRPR